MKVFITRKIPENGIRLLKQKGHKVKVGSQVRNLAAKEIAIKGKGADALLCLLTDTIDGKLMDALGPQLKVIANYAVGFDNIDVGAARKRSIQVTNTPGVLTEAVAEHAVALIFGIVRRLAESDRFVRAKKYKGWEPELFLGEELQGKILGIVGHGRTGCRVADILQKGLGMKVLYYDVVRDKKAEARCGIQYASFFGLLKKADVVSLHVPLLPSTRHLISRKELSAMKKTAYLINTSRGPVVDEKMLVKAMKKNWITGAALDVFESEPAFTPGLLDLENVLLTPHIASATRETRKKMAELAAKNIIAVLSGKKPQNPVRI